MGLNSLGTTEFDHHKAMRKALGPAFTPQSAMQMLPGMVDIVESCMLTWSREDQIKAQPCIKKFAFQVNTFSIAFSVSCAQISAEHSVDIFKLV